MALNGTVTLQLEQFGVHSGHTGKATAMQSLALQTCGAATFSTNFIGTILTLRGSMRHISLSSLRCSFVCLSAHIWMLVATLRAHSDHLRRSMNSILTESQCRALSM